MIHSVYYQRESIYTYLHTQRNLKQLQMESTLRRKLISLFADHTGQCPLAVFLEPKKPLERPKERLKLDRNASSKFAVPRLCFLNKPRHLFELSECLNLNSARFGFQSTASTCREKTPKWIQQKLSVQAQWPWSGHCFWTRFLKKHDKLISALFVTVISTD